MAKENGTWIIRGLKLEDPACLTYPFARHSPERWVTAAAFWGILSMEKGNLPWTL